MSLVYQAKKMHDRLIINRHGLIFFWEMADVIICVKYAPNGTGNRISTRVRILQVCATVMFFSAEAVNVPLPALDQICHSPGSYFWLSYFKSGEKHS